MQLRTIVIGTAAAASILVGGCTTTASTTTASSPSAAAGLGPLSPEAKRDIGEGYRDSLRRLYETTPGSRELVSKAAGVLVFPAGPLGRFGGGR